MPEVASHMLQAASYKLQASSCKLKIIFAIDVLQKKLEA
jgi:hypothetical protein